MLAELVQMLTCSVPAGILLLPRSRPLLPPRACTAPEGSVITLAFLNACGILAQGTNQASRVSMLAGMLSSAEFAQQAARIGKSVLTAIVGGRRGLANR